MELIKASEQDNQRLRDYFWQSPLPAKITLKIDRQKDFFGPYKIQSDDFATYMLVNSKDQSLQASASLVFRKAWVEGKEQTVGFATDLRVSNNRKAILEWSNYFLPILKEEQEKRQCEYIFSMVTAGQSQVNNAFIRPRSVRRQMPRYYSFRRFDVVSVHGRYPFAPKPLASIDTRRAQPQDLDALAEFVVRKMQRKTLHFNGNKETFLANIKRWPQLKMEDFILAVDKMNNIVGCTALWNPDCIQKFYPSGYDTKTTALKDGLNFLSYLGVARKLPPADTPFSLYTLSYLLADNPDIFYSLLSKAYNSIDKRSFLVYPHFEGDLITKPGKSFITSSLHSSLYCVMSPDKPAPSFLKPKLFSEAPDFDLAFI